MGTSIIVSNPGPSGPSGLDVGDGFGAGLGEMRFVPGEGAVDGIDDVLGFAEAVAFAGVADENGFGSDVFECDEELLGFGDRHVVVIFAVEDVGRRMRSGYMF